MNNLGDDSDTVDFDLEAMLEAMKAMKAPPDYHAIVKADWESIHAKLKETLVDLVKADVVSGIAEKYQDRLSLEYNLAILIDGKMPLKKSTIQEVLPNFPNETIIEIAKVVFQFDVERIWGSRSNAGQVRVNVAKRKRTLLCKTKERLSNILSQMETHLLECVSTRGYPTIISLSLEDSVRSLNDALKLADAYTELLDAELKKYSKGEYSTKHHPIWREIYSAVAKPIEEVQSVNQSLKYESCVRLTAKVMAAVYPWYWGKISQRDAEKHILAGCKVLTEKKRASTIK